MNKRFSLAIVATLILAVPVWADCGYCGSGGKSDTGQHTHAHAEIGKPAPDFAIKGIDGKEYKLSELKGKVVVLEWINYQCPVVNRCHQAKTMSDTLAKFKGKPVVWLAIDSSHFCEDKADDVRKWVKERKIEYAYLLDAAGKVGHIYGAKTTPHMFVIDQKGVLAYTGAIDEGSGSQGGSTGRSQRNYVAEAVTALLSGSTVATTTTKSYGCSVKYKS